MIQETNIYSSLNVDPSYLRIHNNAVRIAHYLFQDPNKKTNYKITDDGTIAIVAHRGHINFYITDRIQLYNNDAVNKKDANKLEKACKSEGFDLPVINECLQQR